MAGEIIQVPRTDEMLECLDRVAELVTERAEDADFEEPIREFWDAFFVACDELGLCETWTPDEMLLILTQCLLFDETLPLEVRLDYASAVAVIRDVLIRATLALADLN